MPTSKRIEPGPGRESVWDYPRPPRLEPSTRLIRVEFAGRIIAETRASIRALETSHPPVYYIPAGDVLEDVVIRTARSTFCEFKGRAGYFDLELDGRRSKEAGWFYPNPSHRFASIRDHLAFYPSRVDACTVDGEVVRAQEGDFYGGWITPEIVGPFKGPPGTMGW